MSKKIEENEYYQKIAMDKPVYQKIKKELIKEFKQMKSKFKNLKPIVKLFIKNLYFSSKINFLAFEEIFRQF